MSIKEEAGKEWPLLLACGYWARQVSPELAQTLDRALLCCIGLKSYPG